MDEDIALMLQVKADDMSAYEKLYRQYQQPLANFFYRMGCEDNNVEDCVQEVFLRIWRSRASYEPSAKFTTFLFQIAKNYWINETDKKKRRGIMQFFGSLLGEDNENYDVTDISPSPLDGIEQSELQKKIYKAISSLKEKHRLVFILSQIEGLKYKDIAEILDIPIGTVKSRMTVAEQQLREKLKDYVVYPPLEENKKGGDV